MVVVIMDMNVENKHKNSEFICNNNIDWYLALFTKFKLF
ncbi:hypothetical Protein YC6258_04202 [Gynuella sunshinyii YC6258]|uniref:Uncharacterized protein n=1 Tax=Gynuella sunshinyii YC6258 TaxID=1445510 RepID=A0A0C5VA87_9GAMM|nr:hypothetical Protein YC6258_04202 [Gynuella sunshinyii YC6258]